MRTSGVAFVLAIAVVVAMTAQADAPRREVTARAAPSATGPLSASTQYGLPATGVERGAPLPVLPGCMVVYEISARLHDAKGQTRESVTTTQPDGLAVLDFTVPSARPYQAAPAGAAPPAADSELGPQNHIVQCRLRREATDATRDALIGTGDAYEVHVRWESTVREAAEPGAPTDGANRNRRLRINVDEDLSLAGLNQPEEVVLQPDAQGSKTIWISLQVTGFKVTKAPQPPTGT